MNVNQYSPELLLMFDLHIYPRELFSPILSDIQLHICPWVSHERNSKGIWHSCQIFWILEFEIYKQDKSENQRRKGILWAGKHLLIKEMQQNMSSRQGTWLGSEKGCLLGCYRKFFCRATSEDFEYVPITWLSQDVNLSREQH